MNNKTTETKVNIDPSVIYNAIVTGAVGLFYWGQRQDKLRIKSLEDRVSSQSELVARQDERHKALAADVGEIKEDTKEIKRLLVLKRER